MANDDPILTTMIFIPQHEVVQNYGAILPDNLTTLAMKEPEAYKTYYAFATRKATPKPKYVRQTSKEKTKQAPKATSGKRLKATAKISWKSSDEDDDNQDDDDERTESENEGDDFVNPKFTTYDSGERHDDEEGDKEESFDPKVHTLYQDKFSDDKVTQGYNVEEENIDDEITNEEEEANDLYKDVNVNMEGRDIDMTDAP
ncbi:hypothetical protein Tco_1408566 [Tanacetum coccineum]